MMNVEPKTAELVRQLLADGLPRRQIAEQARVSRHAVDQIAEGTYRGQPIPRCPGCGARVTPPCLACRAANWWREARRHIGASAAPVGLELESDDQERYDQVRAAREAAGQMSADDDVPTPEGSPGLDLEVPTPRHHGYRGSLDNDTHPA